MTKLTEVPEWRFTRNFIRPGDVVKIAEPGRRFQEHKVKRLFANPEGEVVEIETVGPRGFRQLVVANVKIERLAMTRIHSRGERGERRSKEVADVDH